MPNKEFIKTVKVLVSDIRKKFPGADDKLIEAVLENEFHFPPEFEFVLSNGELQSKATEVKNAVDPKGDYRKTLLYHISKILEKAPQFSTCYECGEPTYINPTIDGRLHIQCQDVCGCMHDSYYGPRKKR